MRTTLIAASIIAFIALTTEASTTLNSVQRTSVVDGLGIVWSNPRVNDGTIEYHGTAFRVTIEGKYYWVTAAHVVHEVQDRGKIFISPSLLQPNGRFAPPETDDRAVTNSVHVRPAAFVAADTSETLSKCSKEISLPYTIKQSVLLENPGNDVCIVDGASNFTESKAFLVRDLQKAPLASGERLYFAGYPLDGLGKLLQVPCKFEGFTVYDDSFRGVLFCSSSIFLGGFSGGPILDRNGHVMGALSSELSLGENTHVDRDGHNRVVYFTPIRARGAVVDGFNRDEIDRQKCLQVSLVRNRLKLSKLTSCKLQFAGN